MPSLQLNAEQQNLSSDSEEVYYNFGPGQFELFPKVNKLLRTTFCNLALWNVDDQYPDIPQTNNAAENWALGQVFIRQNGLNIEWQFDSSNQDRIAVISFTKANENNSSWFGWFLASLVLTSLCVYLGILTVKKFRRIKEQNDQFKKIKILTSNFELEVSPEFAEVFKAQQADRDFLENKDYA